MIIVIGWCCESMEDVDVLKSAISILNNNTDYNCKNELDLKEHLNHLYAMGVLKQSDIQYIAEKMECA